MEMSRRSANGSAKVVTFDDAVAGMRRNGSLSSSLSHGMASRRRTYTDGELDVFTAERYFTGAIMDGGNGGPHKVAFTDAAAAVAPPVETPAAVVIAKPASSSTRVSTASSVSSANSQTVLIRGGGSHGRRRGSGEKKCCVQVGLLMRTCSGKRSVRVDGGCASATTKEAHGAGGEVVTASRIDWYRELRMQKAAHGLPGDGGNTNGHGRLVAAAGLPPSLGLGGTAKVAAIGREQLTRDEKKASGELTFSSPSSVRRSFALVAPVRATVPAASNRIGDFTVEAGNKCGDGEDDGDEDAGSESSSDLFEIKSLMIEECPYEPSEASVQWSVVTADASERGGDRVSARWATGGGGRAPLVGGRQYRPVGLLAGCASHRAVDVSAAVTKAVPNAAAEMQRRGDGLQKARNGGA
ncbi:hypothetical protein HU200_021908 [Digitaria exilis]|uniref:Uncharacterized protein n=1 Tax=Digitaria exilis TaxID=1010633 RepID=A0A835EYJ6_9POAL|nr:hypothetical protein HU200_021908 [Digitaria exilis]CAB3494742.1 unnamed protein product [Digitaria exilis]